MKIILEPYTFFWIGKLTRQIKPADLNTIPKQLYKVSMLCLLSLIKVSSNKHPAPLKREIGR